jgi:hypothetical protein
MKRIAPILLALLALPAAAAQTGHAVYRPGLTQARIPFPSAMGYLTAYDGVPMLASNLLANADASWLDRTLDVFKDGEHPNAATNPVSGKTWPWLIEHNHGVFAYEGEMFVEGGVEYSFYGRSDTGEALVVDGETVVWQGVNRGWQYGPEIHRRWTAPKTGWVPFNGWLWSWNGSYGTQWSEWSLQYNVQGVVVTFLDPTDRLSDRYDSLNSWLEENRGLTNVWQRFADTGAGTFLRTVTGERFTTVGASSAAAGGRSFDLVFTGVPTNATLVAFTGPADGLHATSEWASASAVLAEVPPGDSTTNVTVALAADATVLRFRLAHFDAASTNGLAVFEEWTEMVPVSASPVVRVDSASPGYTNLVVAGSLGSFGIGGSSGAVTIQVAAPDDAGFIAPVAELELPPASAVGAFEAELFGLSTNTAYLVRAMATNDLGTAGFSPAVPFRTREPGPPSASVAATICALFSADLTATVSDWGGGSWGAEAWIDVSASSNFPAGETQTISLGALSGPLPASATGTATGLAMSSDYYARVRVTNSWGCATVSDPVAFSTDDQPIRFPHEADVVAAKGSVSATLAPTFVTEGTVYDVKLTMEGITGGRTWRNQTGYGPFAFTQYTAAGNEVVFVYAIAWRYGDQSGEVEVRGRAIAKLADRTIESVPEIETLRPYLRPGDTLEIIPSDGARVDWHTNAVLRITPTNGVFLLEALEPGATLLYETSPSNTLTGATGQTIVLPAEDPAGGIYIHRGFADWTWTDPAAWEMVVAGPQGYPDAAGAVAYVVAPQISEASGPSDHMIEITEPITLGYLAVGQLGRIHHYYNDKTQFYLQFVDQMGAGGSFLFKTVDGSPSWIRLLGHCYVTSPLKMNVPVTLANDLDLDALGRIPDSDGWKSWRDHGFKINAPLDFGPYTFRTIRDTYYYGRWNLYSRGFITINDDVRGSGTIRLEADTAVGMNDGSDAWRLKSFTGVWDVANGQFNTSGYGGCGLFFGDARLGNASAIVFRGAWHPADASENKGAHSRSGYKDEGAWTNDWHDIFPSKVTLDGGWIVIGTRGGTMNADAKAAYQATGIRRAHYEIGELVVPAGPQGRLDTYTIGSTADYPNNLVDITNLVMDANAVLSFTLVDTSGSVSNEVFIHNDPPSFYADPDEGVQFLPQLFANYEADTNDKLIFRDPGSGKLEKRSASADGTKYRRFAAAATLANGDSFRSMQVAKDVAVSFADGATVGNLGGYLDLRGGAALGRPGDDADATLDFGDAVARVYVGKRADTATIGCKLTGSAGLVKGGSGILALAASADGIAGGVRVAGGTLRLGAAVNGTNHVGRIAGNVRVEAGSRLAIGCDGALAAGVRLYLNDRDWIPSHAHVRLDANAEAARLLIDGEPMPNGYYGSSEAAAANLDTHVVVDDVHFEGTGILWAGIRPTMLILR